MPKVDFRKTILVKQTLANNNVWEQVINIDFIPDEVIVRSIMYNGDPAAREHFVGYVWTDLVNDNFLGIFADGFSNNPQQVFHLSRPIKGVYNFQARAEDDTIDNGQGVLMITLEFVKYK